MIERAIYLNKLIRKQWNGKIKIITGIRRSGKSTLLFDIYREYLLNSGALESDIIAIALDDDSTWGLLPLCLFLQSSVHHLKI